MRKSILSKLNIKHGAYIRDAAQKQYVYHVETPQILIQAAGYLKHFHAKTEPKTVFYRGQDQLYGGALRPSLYRGLRGSSGQSKHNNLMNNFLAEIEKDKSVLRKVDAHIREPLLQHYGIRTRWIDVVDNIWVALWFACYEARVVGKEGQYLHFERRRITRGAHAYIVLVEADLQPVPNRPGCYFGPDTETVDLRVAAPSVFIRPHAQHALLTRAKPKATVYPFDYSDLITGIIRVRLQDAIDWLGEGALLTPHVLFPSPFYDAGYQQLLESTFPPMGRLGTINHVGV